MTTENISNEQLLKDINITEQELSAYDSLYKAFRILAHLPENVGSSMERVYNFEYEKYLNLANECNRFFNKLNDIKSERGL
jgi:hypothetical protein